MKQFLVKFEITSGDLTFDDFRFIQANTLKSAEKKANQAASTFYSDKPSKDKSLTGYYHNMGMQHVRVWFVTPVSKQEHELLLKFL